MSEHVLTTRVALVTEPRAGAPLMLTRDIGVLARTPEGLELTVTVSATNPFVFQLRGPTHVGRLDLRELVREGLIALDMEGRS